MDHANPIDALFARAKLHNVPMTAICKRVDIAPSTPSRWKRGKNGATLDKVSQLTGALNDIIRERAA